MVCHWKAFNLLIAALVNTSKIEQKLKMILSQWIHLGMLQCTDLIHSYRHANVIHLLIKFIKLNRIHHLRYFPLHLHALVLKQKADKFVEVKGYCSKYTTVSVTTSCTDTNRSHNATKLPNISWHCFRSVLGVVRVGRLGDPWPQFITQYSRLISWFSIGLFKAPITNIYGLKCYQNINLLLRMFFLANVIPLSQCLVEEKYNVILCFYTRKWGGKQLVFCWFFFFF